MTWRHSLSKAHSLNCLEVVRIFEQKLEVLTASSDIVSFVSGSELLLLQGQVRLLS